MCKTVETVRIEKAIITPRIAHYLGCLQANDNEDLHMMLGNIIDMKRFFISLQGQDIDANEILGQLGNIQYIEDALKELMYNEIVTKDEKRGE